MPRRGRPSARADGPAIRALRRKQGIRTAELAASAGIAAITLANIENGWNRTSPETLHRIAHALGIDVSEITRDSNGDDGTRENGDAA